nr:matrixin family metalloprotease [Carnobacterium maltaromaticum]
MKKSFKVFCLILIMLPIFLTTTSTAKAAAYRTWGRNRLSVGVGNYGRNTKYYWYSGGFATASDQNTVNNAMSKWTNSNGTGAYTPISFRRTASQANSTIDFHRGGPVSGVLGYTQMFVGSNVINFSSQSWYWAKITMTTAYTYSTQRTKNITVAHEAGHAMGLDHNDTISATVMRTKLNNSMPTGPSINDFSGINYLYK